MRPSGRSGELFDAFSRITAKVFAGDRLLSCPTLSKAPNYGQVLRRFVKKTPLRPLGPMRFLRLCIRYLCVNFAHIGFLALSATFIRLIGWEVSSERFRNPEAPLLLIDSFAILPKIVQEDRFQEAYLPGLAEEASRLGHDVLRFHRLYGSRHPVLLWKSLKILASGQDGLLEAHLFRPSDWGRLLWHVVSYPFALFRLVRSLRRYPPGSPESYIREALINTSGQCIAIGEARRIAGLRLGLLLSSRPFVRSASQPGDQGMRIVSWYENQTVNKSLLRGLSQAEKTGGRHIPVLGAQLFLWPANLLNNHPDDAEAALGLAPDRVLVNGSYFLPEKTRQKYTVGPSLRYAELFRDLPKELLTAGDLQETPQSTAMKKYSPEDPEEQAPPHSSDRQNPEAFSTDHSGVPPILALLSYHPDEVRRVLQMLLPLAEQGTEITYKFHPATQPEHFSAWLPVSPIIAQGSLKTALQSIRYKKGAVLGSGSGSLAEAVAVGIPVLAVQDPEPDLSLNYLPEYGKGLLWESVEDAGDIKAALQKLTAARGYPERPLLLRNFRELLFTEPTPERIGRDFCL